MCVFLRRRGQDHDSAAGNKQGTEPYQKIGSDLGISEGAVKQAALELRREFGIVLRREVRRTVTDEDQVDAEIRYLLSFLRG